MFTADGSGIEHKIEAQEGVSLMELMRNDGVAVIAACGGAGVCGTCHVYVDDARGVASSRGQ